MYEGNADETSGQESPTEEWESVRMGSQVVHPTFGEGVVRSHLGGDKIMVEFTGRGLKKISLKFTQLKMRE